MCNCQEDYYCDECQRLDAQEAWLSRYYEELDKKGMRPCGQCETPISKSLESALCAECEEHDRQLILDLSEEKP